MAWVWRPLIAVGLAVGLGALYGALHTGDLWLVASAAPLLGPAIALGFVVATRIDLETDGTLRIRTLAFIPRRVHRDALGRPHLRLTAAATLMQIDAPRVWIPVRGGLPIYLDLWAQIPDLAALESVIPLSPALRRAIGDS
jgi:hypothetical protein